MADLTLIKSILPRLDCHYSSPLAPWIVRLSILAIMKTPIHLYGETGSGKERIARLLHLLSPIARRPWIAVNCGAFPKGTLESELFGHCRGAFTGAHADRKGVLEQADGGTLFLDEIGELPLEMQTHLLRALQEQEIQRVGEERTRKVNFRLVSASNRQIETMVEQGEMRADLYHRIAGFTLQLPNLADRSMDLPRLAVALWREREGKRGTFPLSAEDLAELPLKTWKGNIRELNNWIYQKALERRWKEESQRAYSSTIALHPIEKIRTEHREQLCSEVMRSLIQNGGNKSAAARTLGIPRTTLDYRLKLMEKKNL